MYGFGWLSILVSMPFYAMLHAESPGKPNDQAVMVDHQVLNNSYLLLVSNGCQGTSRIKQLKEKHVLMGFVQHILQHLSVQRHRKAYGLAKQIMMEKHVITKNKILSKFFTIKSRMRAIANTAAEFVKLYSWKMAVTRTVGILKDNIGFDVQMKIKVQFHLQYIQCSEAMPGHYAMPFLPEAIRDDKYRSGSPDIPRSVDVQSYMASRASYRLPPKRRAAS